MFMRVNFNFRLQQFRVMAGLCLLLVISGCGKGEENAENAGSAGEGQAVNEYSYDSVFENVLRQVQDDPQNENALYHLADLYDRQGQYQKAVETYGKVIEINPERGYAYFKMGTAYSRMGQPEQAVEVLTRAAELLQRNPVVWNNLGIAYGKLERHDKEIESLRRALKIRPRYASARFNLGMAYLEKGDKAAAMEQYEELKATDATMAGELLRRIEGGEGRQVR